MAQPKWETPSISDPLSQLTIFDQYHTYAQLWTSGERGCRAGRSRPSGSLPAFMPWPAISAIFCAPWRRQNQFKGWSLISLEENLIKIGRASGATATVNVLRDFTADREIASAAGNRIFTSIWNSSRGTRLIFWAPNRRHIDCGWRAVRNPAIGI